MLLLMTSLRCYQLTMFNQDTSYFQICILGEVYFPTTRALRCGFGEEAGILHLATRGVAIDNITERTVEVKLSAVLDPAG